jgi:hypothetical protein
MKFCQVKQDHNQIKSDNQELANILRRKEIIDKIDNSYNVKTKDHTIK